MSFFGNLLGVIRAQPIAAAVYASTMGLGAAGISTAGYWVYLQPDPRIVAVEMPITNGGIEAIKHDGRPYVVPSSIVPVEKKVFRSGEIMWTLRYDCFLFKTSGDISRVFINKATGAQWALQKIPVPSRTDGCARRNFATPIPAELDAGDWTYVVSAEFYKNLLQPAVRTLFPSVDITVTK